MKKWLLISAAFLSGILCAFSQNPVEIHAAVALNGYTVGIDPGHQGPNVDMSDPEPNGPGSSEMKAKATSGTQGAFTGLPEYQLNLDVSLKLKSILENRGYQVILTRTDNDTAISNKERAEYVAREGTDIYVRIHANGSDSPEASGALTISPSSSNPYISPLYEDSNRLSQCILDAYCSATGFANLDVMYSDTMTGINWSTVPVTIVEMGFMTNENDDRKMSDAAFQDVMAEGIADGIDDYFGLEAQNAAAAGDISDGEVFGPPAPEGYIARGQTSPGAETSESADFSSGEGMLSPSHGSSAFTDAANTDEDLDKLLTQVSSLLPPDNGDWSVYICNLQKGTEGALNAQPMQAASLIKLFIMGAVYENYDALSQVYGVNAINQNLNPMITVSDNDAANTLVNWLGNGDNTAGMQVVNTFCQNHGYTNTSMGRMLLASNEFGDNYTSVSDCGKFLKEVYKASQGTAQLSALSHAEEMYELLRQQTRTNKIPANMPEGVHVANKTGELSDVENDAGIVFDTAKGTDLIICFMSQNLNDTAAAQTLIAQNSRMIYGYYNE